MLRMEIGRLFQVSPYTLYDLPLSEFRKQRKYYRAVRRQEEEAAEKAGSSTRDGPKPGDTIVG